MGITLFALAIIFIAKLGISGDFTHMTRLLLFIIALAVSVVPEALPVIATITLSNGAFRLAKKHVLVKRLSSLEDLGNITLLCTDKTGTLTENKTTIQDIIAEDKELFQVLAFAAIEVVDEKRKRIKNSYDAAFEQFIPQHIHEKAKKYMQLKEFPFDPQIRRRRIILENKESKKQYIVVIGAVDILLDMSDMKEKEQFMGKIRTESTQGLRHMAFAYKEISYESGKNIADYEKKLKFLGYATLIDPLRATAKHTIELAEKLGVAIKILTGDEKEVAAYVGHEIGLLKENDIVPTGDEMAKMTVQELRNVVFTRNVFAKVTPQQKYEIIKLLKEKYVVGYQGDGINDAPSLKLADVGIAVNTATDVAKESSEILLLRKDLEVIINGIEYGRTIFVNINKYIKYTMVGNFGNFLALAGLYLLSSDLPLLPVQLLLTNLLTDLPLICIYSDNVNTYQVKKPQRFNIHSLM